MMSSQKFELFVKVGIDYEDLAKERSFHILQAIPS
jgi:hypothetical protein